jgi:hypothetical protein
MRDTDPKLRTPVVGSSFGLPGFFKTTLLMYPLRLPSPRVLCSRLILSNHLLYSSCYGVSALLFVGHVFGFSLPIVECVS